MKRSAAQREDTNMKFNDGAIAPGEWPLLEIVNRD